MGKEDLPWAGQVTSARVRVHCNIKARADQRTHNNKHAPPTRPRNAFLTTSTIWRTRATPTHPPTYECTHDVLRTMLGPCVWTRMSRVKKVTSNFEQALEPTSEKTPVEQECVTQTARPQSTECKMRESSSVKKPLAFTAREHPRSTFDTCRSPVLWWVCLPEEKGADRIIPFYVFFFFPSLTFINKKKRNGTKKKKKTVVKQMWGISSSSVPHGFVRLGTLNWFRRFKSDTLFENLLY